MTVLFRCRVEKPLLIKVNSVTERLGTNTGESVRMFLAEIAHTGRIGVRLALEPDETAVSPWEQRAATLESFYENPKPGEAHFRLGKRAGEFFPEVLARVRGALTYLLELEA